MRANLGIRGVYYQFAVGAEPRSASLTNGCIRLIDALASLTDYIAGHELFSIQTGLGILC
jgi:hypothetical protein